MGDRQVGKKKSMLVVVENRGEVLGRSCKSLKR